MTAHLVYKDTSVTVNAVFQNQIYIYMLTKFG